MLPSSPEAKDALRESFLFWLTAGAVEQLLQDAVPLAIPAGSVLYPEHGQAQVGLVLSGLLRVYMTSAEGRQVTVRYARQGDVLGIAVVVGGPARTSVQALTDAKVLMLNVGTLRDLGRRDAEVAWAFAEELGRRLYDVLEELAGNVFGSVRQRVARHLLDLAARQGPGPLVVSATQQDIAGAVGSVREVVARVLKELKAEHLIDSTRTGIHIVDAAGLHEAART
jgi:CRP/FNR family cyclic AMP-dependent transcriptional regulator